MVLVEDDDGHPLRPALGSLARVLVGVGSIRSIAALVPLAQKGAIALNLDVPFTELIRAVAAALQPGPRSARAIAERVRRLRHREREAHRLARLTPAERRVLQLMLTGQPAARIAGLTNRSEHTVRSQIRAVLTKLEARSQLTAVAVAHRGFPTRAATDVHFINFGDDPTLWGV